MESTAIIGADTWAPILEALTAQISASTVIGVLGSVVAICAGFAFMWWGVRKVSSMLMNAFKKGKISL